MRYRKLDDENDYSFGSGQLDFWRDVPEAVGQAVETGLMLWQGEWYLDTTEGTPYIAGVLGKHSQDTADSTIKNQAISTQGVTDISSYVSELDTTKRDLKIQIKVNTVYGPTQVQIDNYKLY